MEVGIFAMAFGLVMLGVIKLYAMGKKDAPKPLFWLVVGVIAVISIYLVMTRGCTPEKFAYLSNCAATDR
jgi:uncharacterized membrane protein